MLVVLISNLLSLHHAQSKQQTILNKTVVHLFSGHIIFALGVTGSSIWGTCMPPSVPTEGIIYGYTPPSLRDEAGIVLFPPSDFQPTVAGAAPPPGFQPTTACLAPTFDFKFTVTGILLPFDF